MQRRCRQAHDGMIDLSSFSSVLRLSQDGVWDTPERQAVSYPDDGHSHCLAIEEESFWFRHRNACIAAAVHRFPPPMGGPIFDVGGGNGYVAAGLSRAGFECVLVEPGRGGALNAKKRGLPTVVCATLETAGFRPRSLPAVGLFDVIEHSQDDLAFLSSVSELLVPRGRLYATVPAYQILWSKEDDDAGHFRRYTTASISSVLTAARFQIDYSSYIFRFLPLPISILRALPYRIGLHRLTRPPGTAAKEHRVSSGLSGAVLSRLLAGEVSNVAAGRTMRIGGSCLLVGRVP
jgi:SAM-dependent methyltransferase